ncbi:MAG: hypothetical protein GQ547_00860 [Methylophaga sp.]|nr:hypothetical protein [Methylophaga sp.]
MNMKNTAVERLISIFFLYILFVIAPFYLQPNVGGLGLTLPFNIASWSVAIFFIASVTITMVRHHSISYTHLFSLCLLFPIIIIMVGLFANTHPQPVIWLFRQLYIIGGLLFLFSLFQINFKTVQIEKILYSLVFASLLHSLVGVAEIIEFKAAAEWLPLSKQKLPIGMFQQVNLQAIYLVTGLLSILYLISRPSFSARHVFLKGMLVITFGLAVYIVLSTGSRAGLLSLVSGCTLMIISRYRQLLRHRKVVSLIIIVSCVAVLGGQGGFERASNKLQKVTEGEYKSIRSTMYATTIDLITKKPILGYGIGSFPRVWADQSIIFAKNNPDTNISQATTNHPHNEILLWMVEGGLLSVVGILIIFMTVAYALYLCGRSRGGAYAALLLPISFHTQVELPFYGSSVHWFLWLFLIFIVFRHQIKEVRLNITKATRYSIQIAVVLVAFIGLSFLLHAGKAQKEIYDYKFNGGGDLRVPLNNLYFNSVAQRMIMENMLYSSIENKDWEQIPIFIKWAEDYIEFYPAQGMYPMLADAYKSIGDDKNQCRIAKKGVEIYTQKAYLLNILDECGNRKDDKN